MRRKRGKRRPSPRSGCTRPTAALCTCGAAGSAAGSALQGINSEGAEEAHPSGKRGRPSAHVATRQAQPLGRHPPGTLRDRPHESPTPPGHQTRYRDAHLQGRPARQGRQQQMRAGTGRYGCETRCRGSHLCRQPDRRGSEHSGGCPGTVRNAEAMWHLRECRRLQRAGAGTCAVVGLGARDHCLTQPAGRCERVDSQDMPRVEGKEMCGSR